MARRKIREAIRGMLAEEIRRPKPAEAESPVEAEAPAEVEEIAPPVAEATAFLSADLLPEDLDVAVGDSISVEAVGTVDSVAETGLSLTVTEVRAIKKL